jgi:hypothetical protein
MDAQKCVLNECIDSMFKIREKPTMASLELLPLRGHIIVPMEPLEIKIQTKQVTDI